MQTTLHLLPIKSKERFNSGSDRDHNQTKMRSLLMLSNAFKNVLMCFKSVSPDWVHWTLNWSLDWSVVISDDSPGLCQSLSSGTLLSSAHWLRMGDNHFGGPSHDCGSSIQFIGGIGDRAFASSPPLSVQPLHSEPQLIRSIRRYIRRNNSNDSDIRRMVGRNTDLSYQIFYGNHLDLSLSS